MTLRDLARKDVIRLSNGENLGRIDDIEFEEKSAHLTAVVLHGRRAVGQRRRPCDPVAEHQNHWHGCRDGGA